MELESTGAEVIDYAAEEIPAATNASSAECLVIDHFDEAAGVASLPRQAPDLRLVSRHLRRRKVCIVTNRPLTDKSHELVRQLRYATRLEALAVRNLEVVNLEAWPVAAVQRSIDEHLPEASKHFSNIAAAKNVELGSLLKPMVLRMLLSVLHQRPQDWIPEYGEIYDLYLEHTLSWDYDQGRSQISSITKREVLTGLAYSLFSGKDRSARRPGVVSSTAIGEALKEVQRNPDGTGIGATKDFLTTNRCLVSAQPANDQVPDEWVFESKTVFEYFLAEAIVSRYCARMDLGVRESEFNPSILDTRMLYFARRSLARCDPDAATAQLQNSALGKADRMILLYLIEDQPRFVELLLSSPEDYFNYLGEVAQRVDYHFMVKIARFQLVSAGRMSASEYLDFIQLSEEPSHLEVELQICRTPTGNVDYLETRFRNPSLSNSSAISIYRIAQLDPEFAKNLLEGQTALTEVQVKECKDAFTRALESNSRRLRPTV
jgi:hypothetical protein